MIKKPFFGLSRPSLKYPVFANGQKGPLKEIPLPQKATLFLPPHIKIHELGSMVGEKVRTGQRLKLTRDGEDYLISTITGIITGFSEYTGYLAKTCPAVSIETESEDQWDEEFSGKDEKINPQVALDYLNCLPGGPDFPSLLSFQPPVNTLIINCIDKDLLISTNQIVLEKESESIIQGVEYLKKITRASRIYVVVPKALAAKAEKMDAFVHAIDPVYPHTRPEIIVKNLLGTALKPGKACEEIGIGFIKAEAVASLAQAL